MSLRTLFVCTFVALGVSSPLLASEKSADAYSRKVDRAIRAAQRRGAKSHRVIVMLEPGCADSITDVLEKHGDRVNSFHAIINAISGEIHDGDVDALAATGCVKSIAADAVVHAGAAVKDAAAAPQVAPPSGQTTVTNTLRDTLGLPHYAALDTSVPTGASGVGVAIIDSGIAPSVDFQGRITSFYDFTHGGIATDPYDDFGHGTHVAGLIGSSGKLSNYEFQGVAPSVNLIGLKVLDKNGAGQASDVINAIEFVVANRSRLNVQIINLSLGHPISTPAADDPLVQAVEKASAAGLLVVVSAGNFGQTETDKTTTGYAGITSPGNAPSAITVGAAMTNDTIARWDDAVAAYSSRGPSWFDGFAKPDVLAPGHRLASDTNVSAYLYKSLQSAHVQTANGQPLLQLSGSSMAAAVTTGVVALAVQAHNQNGLHRQKPLTANLVKAILQYCALPVGDADYLTQGAGEINAAGAIALGRAIDTSRDIGSYWISVNMPAVSTIGGETYYWSQRIIYGDKVLQGDSISANNVVWGTNVVWGSLADDDNVVWGTSVVVVADDIVWGNVSVWATNVVWGSQIVWGSQVVWGTLSDDNVVWGTTFQSDTVWGADIRK